MAKIKQLLPVKRQGGILSAQGDGVSCYLSSDGRYAITQKY